MTEAIYIPKVNRIGYVFLEADFFNGVESIENIKSFYQNFIPIGFGETQKDGTIKFLFYSNAFEKLESGDEIPYYRIYRYVNVPDIRKIKLSKDIFKSLFDTNLVEKEVESKFGCSYPDRNKWPKPDDRTECLNDNPNSPYWQMTLKRWEKESKSPY